MRATLLLAMLGLLTACPRQRAPEPVAAPQVTPAADGVKVTKGAPPPGWPDAIALYPGAEVVEGREGQNNGLPLLTVILQTGDESEKVIQFYGLQASQQRFNVVSTSQVAGETVSLYRRDDLSLAVSTRRDPAAALTLVEVTLAGKFEKPKAEPPRNSGAGNGSKADKKKPPRPPAPGHPLMPVYPGADAEDPSMSGGSIQRRMTTTDNSSQVEGFYSGFYRGEGFTQAHRMVLQDQLTVTYRGPRGEAALNISQLSDAAGEARTRVTLTFTDS